MYYMYMYISTEVYCTRELTRCESTVASLLCSAKPKVSQKYILQVAFPLGGPIAASAQLKEGVIEPPLPPPPPPLATRLIQYMSPAAADSGCFLAFC